MRWLQDQRVLQDKRTHQVSIQITEQSIDQNTKDELSPQFHKSCIMLI